RRKKRLEPCFTQCALSTESTGDRALPLTQFRSPSERSAASRAKEQRPFASRGGSRDVSANRARSGGRAPASGPVVFQSPRASSAPRRRGRIGERARVAR